MATKLNKAEITALANAMSSIMVQRFSTETKLQKEKYINLFYRSKEGKLLKKAKTCFVNLSISTIENQQITLLGYKPISKIDFPTFTQLVTEITLLNAKKLGLEEIIKLLYKKHKLTI
tara:strand:+ start:7277 stop:7630 length:354 start_codon:yes stop_codon:yes gene_type:complete